MDNEIQATTTDNILIPFPKIYSKKVIWVFSILFSTIFGGVLLMQNLKDTGNRKTANWILFGSAVYTIICIILVNTESLVHNSSFVYVLNAIGGLILSEYFFKKYFPNDDKYEKKKIWKALIISIIITIPFLLAAIYNAENP